MQSNGISISINQARKLLGSKSKKMSDELILEHIKQAEMLAEIAVTHLVDSKIKSGLLREPNPGDIINL